MRLSTPPTIQDVIDKARRYMDQGLSQEEAIRKVIDELNSLKLQQKVHHKNKADA